MAQDSETISLLNRLNAVRVNGIAAREHLIFEKYNVWHFFQQKLYYECRAFLNKDLPPQPSSASTYIKENILAFLTLAVTLLAGMSFVFKKRKVIVYSIDKVSSDIDTNDFRLNEIYTLLKNHSISYVEVFYTLLNRQFVDNFLKRKRFALYERGIDVIYSVVALFSKESKVEINTEDFAHFSTEEQVFVKKTLENYTKNIPRIVFRVKLLKFFFKLSGAKILFTIDSARDYHEAILAAKLLRIPTYAFQHGFYTSAFVGWFKGDNFAPILVAPDIIYVWSEYWKKVLEALNSVFPHIEIGGFSKLPPPHIEPEKHEGITVLVPYEAQASQQEVAEYIKNLLENKNIHIIFKTRPDRTPQSQLHEYNLDLSYNNLSVESNTDVALKKSDIVLGTYSTFLYDMVMSERPVVLVETAIEWGLDMVRFGLATYIKKTDKASEKIQEAMETSREELQKRKKLLCGACNQLLSKTVDEIAIKYNLYD